MVTIISIPFVLKFISTHHILPVTASTLEGWGTQLHMADFTHLHILIHLDIPPTNFTHLHIPPPALLLALLIVTVCDALATQRLLLTCHTTPSDALSNIYVAKNYLDDRWYLNEREGTFLSSRAHGFTRVSQRNPYGDFTALLLCSSCFAVYPFFLLVFALFLVLSLFFSFFMFFLVFFVCFSFLLFFFMFFLF